MTGAQARTTHYRDLYIGGDWRAQAGTGSIDVLSASTEEVIGSIPEGNARRRRSRRPRRSRGVR